jgi:hypothetical protein
MPDDVMQASRELFKQRVAVQQGRQTQDALDLRLEKFVSEVQAKYPDYASDVGSTCGLRDLITIFGVNNLFKMPNNLR